MSEKPLVSVRSNGESSLHGVESEAEPLPIVLKRLYGHLCGNRQALSQFAGEYILQSGLRCQEAHINAFKRFNSRCCKGAYCLVEVEYVQISMSTENVQGAAKCSRHVTP